MPSKNKQPEIPLPKSRTSTDDGCRAGYQNFQ
jgi:hypothetical protein